MALEGIGGGGGGWEGPGQGWGGHLFVVVWGLDWGLMDEWTDGVIFVC